MSVPLLIRLLGIDEFGRWGLYEPLFAIIASIALLGGNFGALRFATEDRYSVAWLYRTHLYIGIWPVVVVVLAAGISTYYLGVELGEALIFLIIIFTEALVALQLAIFRGANKAGQYAIIVILKMSVFLTLLLLSLLGVITINGLKDILWFWLVGLLIGGSVGAISIFGSSSVDRYSESRPDIYKRSIKYGAPILMTSFLISIFSLADRYALEIFSEGSNIGNYIVHIKIAAILNPVLTMPVALWWPAARLRHERDSDLGARFFVNTATIIFLTYVFLSISIVFVGTWLIRWFAPGESFDPRICIALTISMSMVALGNHVFSPQLLTEGNTHLGILSAAGSVLAFIIVAPILIAKYGSLGAAITTSLASLVYFFSNHAFSQRRHYYAYHYKLYALTIGIMFFIVANTIF